MLFWWSLSACPSAWVCGGWVPCNACAHKCSGKGTQMLCSCSFFPEMQAAGAVVAAPGPMAHAWLGAATFSLEPPPGSQQSSVLGVCTHAFAAPLRDLLSTGRLLPFLVSGALSVCITQLSSFCSLLSSPFFFVCRLPPVPLRCQLPLRLFLLNPFFHLHFFFLK